MKILPKIIASLAATLALATFARADEEKHYKLILSGDPAVGLISIDTEELALGESRTFTSEKGSPVILSRDEHGLEIDVDGEKTRVDLPKVGGEGYEYQVFDEDVELGEARGVEHRVIIKKLGGDAEVDVLDSAGMHIEVHGDVSGEPKHRVEKHVIRLSSEGDALGEGGKRIHVIAHQGEDAADARAKLIASGALDGLDEATRQKILEALGGGE